jgi:hypothetical protein
MWSPFPGPQTEALHSEADELFYGGQAGGGKSDLLLGLSLTQHTKSIVFRREYPQLKDLVSRSREIVSTHGSYNGQDHIWTLDHCSLEFGAVQHETDIQKWQGRAHDLKAFDEITHFSESQFRYLKGWNRTTLPTQRVRVVATGNPPTTAEGEWVIRYWAPWLDSGHRNPAVAGELRWFTTLEGKDTEVDGSEPFEFEGELITPKSRTFIPARLADNPALMATDYGATLQAMPEPLRSQLLYGDFGLTLEDDPWQVIPTEWVRAAIDRWKQTPKPQRIMSSLGVDVARGGRDETVLAPAFGSWFAPLICVAGKDTPDGPSVASLVWQHAEDGKTPIFIDVVGVGSSPFDSLVGMNLPAHPVNGGEKAPENAHDRSGRLEFKNLRAWLWWSLREALDPQHGTDVCLPDDRALLADLSAPKFKVVGTKIQVESKEEIIKRLGRSPDRGDAVTYAWYGAGAAGAFEYTTVSTRRYSKKARGWA